MVSESMQLSRKRLSFRLKILVMTYVVITFRILLNAYIFIVEINYIILGYCSKIYNVIIYIMVLNHIINIYVFEYNFYRIIPSISITTMIKMISKQLFLIIISGKPALFEGCKRTYICIPSRMTLILFFLLYSTMKSKNTLQ